MTTIPIHSLTIPEYKVKVLKKFSGKLFHTYWNIPIPVEYESEKPDFDLAATKIVQTLRRHFMGKRIGFRLLGSMEHPGKSVDELVSIIKKLGHDRYDSKRIGDRYENIDNKIIDIFILEFTVGKKEEEECIRYALESFYYYPIFDRKTPIRIDIGIVYDLKQLERVTHRYKGRENEVKTDGVVFKHPDRKTDALLGIIKIQ
jgi:hypothetical protein